MSSALKRKGCRGYYRFVTITGGGQHDDVIKWKHFPRYWPFVRGIHPSPVNSTHKGHWREALICTCMNGWVNSRDAGDLRRHRAYYAVTVMRRSDSNASCHDNTPRPRQNGRHFADDVFKYIFMNENVWISFKISLKFVPKGRINNNSALVQIMACRLVGDKP